MKVGPWSASYYTFIFKIYQPIKKIRFRPIERDRILFFMTIDTLTLLTRIK